MDSRTSSDVVVREGNPVNLTCEVSGWVRDDGTRAASLAFSSETNLKEKVHTEKKNQEKLKDHLVLFAVWLFNTLRTEPGNPGHDM